jgi:short-subunit dehydrogenase
MPAETAVVVVLTGASSGIGRATALAFARRGARLGLVTRDPEAARDLVAECRALGGAAVLCGADMADADAAERVRETVVAAHGRIDVWVNCAALLLFGRFEDVPPAEFRRVIDVNLIGYANGARAALAQFRAQDNRGLLVNTGSLLGMMGEPAVSAYVASKFAIRGLTACLRQEYRDTPGIRICLVMPMATDTPIYHKAANRFGRKARSIFPVLAPERVAAKIVGLVERPRGETAVGATGVLLRLAAALAPMLLERIVARCAPPLQFEPEAQPPSAGNLFESQGPRTIDGGWRRYWADRLRRRLRL